VRLNPRRAAWAAVAVVMFAAPLAFDLERAPRFYASEAMYPRAVGLYPPLFDPAYYHALLSDSGLRNYMRLIAGARSSVYLDAGFRAGPPGAVTLTVHAETPARARAFVHALALQIAAVSRDQVASQAEVDAKKLRARLAALSLASAERRDASLRLAAVLRVRAAPYERVLVAGPPPLRRPLRRADKLVDALPGAFPPRPSPHWAGLAGLLLVLLVRGILVLARGDRARSRTTPPS
jgi:hypothetical protein